MKHHIYFGETVEGYDIPVLNEREARAGAGILLLPATFSFLNAYLTHDFFFTKIFVTFFMLDFFMRIFINPKYAPTLILGRFFVRNQIPEYVGAPQKRFAWLIGFVLSVVMFFIIVVFEIMTPIKIVICLTCIALLFSETAFGICLGCVIYHKVYYKSPKYCPGNACEIHKKHDIQQISKVQWMIVVLFLIGVAYMVFVDKMTITTPKNTMKCAAGKCGSSMLK
ncbi:MAG: DUF4395 domain-containing protein [Sulfurovum sp.]|nr:DUF4395 domain-containing protein [Sulfurovum sp.]MCB4751177.1 DUF4395 domain-containing protein [Sulfurovum sp.]MCB4755396.1 DUF4395 domain-containing protein [Sulfurovum sp.]MCB4758321.1 DUF4395 domain-containing protein [Sulfurovum sp.]MCB4765460.1 DUF4395 domain-containing protein [Sulfurovum sp.]